MTSETHSGEDGQNEVKQYRAYCGHNMCDWKSEIIESADRHEAESIGMEKADDHEIMHPTHIKEVDDAE